MNRFLPKLGWALLSLVVLLLVALIVARLLFTRYLHSEAFRNSLGQGAANALHADEATFAPLDFDGSLVYGDNFRATRSDGGGFSSINADQLRATFDWHGLLHHKVQIDELAIQRVSIAPPVKTGEPLPQSAPSEPGGLGMGPGPKGWSVDLRKAEINEADWQFSSDPAGGITGTALTLTPDGTNAWMIDAEGGMLRMGNWPSLDLESASMRWQSPTLYINSASLKHGSSRLTVTGSVQTRDSVNLLAHLDNVDIQPLLSPDWRERLTGMVTGDASIQAPLGVGDPARSITVTGTMAMTQGQLTALPILDEIGTFTRTQRFRQLELTHASAEFTRTPDRLKVRNLVVEAEGLIRVEGNYTVQDGQILGDFQVGLTPETLQWIPGSQEEIFLDSRGGYRWASMKLSGPAAHPVDDLTPRLIAATGNTVIKGVEGTVEKAGQSLLDILTH